MTPYALTAIESPSHSQTAMLEIMQRRTLPGLLLLNSKGELIGSNPLADQLLHRRETNALWRSIRDAMEKVKNGKSEDQLHGHCSASPFYYRTFRSGQRTYGVQLFWLNHQPNGDPPLVAAMFERVNPSRLELHYTRRRFGLSPRERDVIHALVTGLSDKEIAARLGLSCETVRYYLKRIRAKLCVSTRTAIINKLFIA
jgi:DNA-binding CsgD family transcriptional regulator